MAFDGRFKVFSPGIICLFILIVSCSIPRDNPMDPKNPNSRSNRKLLVEAFINTNNPYSYNQDMLTALKQLINKYPEKLVVVEYHRNTDQYDDPFHRNENELLYQHYINVINGSKGVPDVFINGTEDRIQGASSIESALFRLQEVISPHLSDMCYYHIIIDYNIEDEILTPIVTLAKLGQDDAYDIMVKGILVTNLNREYNEHIVVDNTEGYTITHMAAGQIMTLDLAKMEINTLFENSLVIYIMDEDEKFVLQCASIIIE